MGCMALPYPAPSQPVHLAVTMPMASPGPLLKEAEGVIAQLCATMLPCVCVDPEPSWPVWAGYHPQPQDLIQRLDCVEVAQDRGLWPAPSASWRSWGRPWGSRAASPTSRGTARG